MVKQISDNEIYLLIKYIKSVLWRVAKRLSYIQEARCLKVNTVHNIPLNPTSCKNGLMHTYIIHITLLVFCCPNMFRPP